MSLKKPKSKNKDWTEVDEASWESFPASDPPAWITGEKDDSSSKFKKSQNKPPKK